GHHAPGRARGRSAPAVHGQRGSHGCVDHLPEHAGGRGLPATDARRRADLPERGVSARGVLREPRAAGHALPMPLPPEPLLVGRLHRGSGEPEPEGDGRAGGRDPERDRGLGALPELPAGSGTQGADRMNDRLKGLADWLDNRTGYRALAKEALYERIPGGPRWRYVWGSALAFAIGVQFITGFVLWAAYSPNAQGAWESVYFIQYQMWGGWLDRKSTRLN